MVWIALAAGFIGGMVGACALAAGAVATSLWRARHMHKPAVLQYIRNHEGRVGALDLYRYVDGHMHIVESLVKDGMLTPDQMPPREFLLTEAGRAAIPT